MSPTPPPLPPGRMLGGKRYKIVKLLGQGGYGSVYLAEDSRLSGRKVAVKELNETSAEAQQLFAAEAAMLAQLDHPGLVRVSDFFDEGGLYYLVMDYIDGQDLLDLALVADQANKMLPLPDVTEWMVQVCEAVAYLHRRQPAIIHRDIKPNNIRLSSGGRAMLVDFGIAKVDPKAKTRKIAKAVSVGFSPPEQYGGAGSTDARSDVYALGATLYCLVTVQPPPDSLERLTSNAPLPSPRKVNPAVTAPLEAVILKAMSLNSMHRYQNGLELLAALQQATGRPASAVPIPIVIPPPVVAPPPVTPPPLICRRCGHTNRPNAAFCPRCGTTLVEPPRCPSCGTAGRPGTRFCARCGTVFSTLPRCRQCGALARPQARFCPSCRAPLGPAAPPRPASDPRPHLSRGRQLLAAQRYQEASQEYEQALLFGAADEDCYTNLGRCYIQLDRFDDAADLLEKGASRHQRSAAIHSQLAWAYLGAQKLTQALQTFELAYRLDPNDFEVALMLIRLYGDTRQHSKAIPILEHARRQEPKNSTIRHRLAFSYLANNQLTEVEQLVKELQRETPNEADLFFLAGMVYLKRNKANQAMKEFQKAIKQEPNHALAHYYIGELYFDQQKWRDAVLAYQKSALVNPDDGDPHARMCLCYISLNRFTEAQAALERALKIDPNHVMANQILKLLADA
jgi:tetratricopeptide (TPR) repeat protein